MDDGASDRVGPMQNPPHPGEPIRESMDDAGWNVAATAARLGCARGTLSRLLNGKAEGVGVHGACAGGYRPGRAGHWMRMQASFKAARARRDRAATKRRVGALRA